MTETPTTAPQQVRKIAVVSETLNLQTSGENNITLTVNPDHFARAPKGELEKMVVGLLEVAINALQEDIDRLQAEENTQAIQQNGGQHYDEIVFDAGLYISDQGQAMVNVAFGRMADAATTLLAGYSHAVDVFGLLKTQYEQENAAHLALPRQA